MTAWPVTNYQTILNKFNSGAMVNTENVNHSPNLICRRSSLHRCASKFHHCKPTASLLLKKHMTKEHVMMHHVEI